MNLRLFEAPKTFNILILDEDPAWRRFVKFTLELELETTPLLATNGQEALDILSAIPIDVVVADLQMPVSDGIQFLQRARYKSPTTKIIMMSTTFEASPQTVPAVIAAGAAATVSKFEIASELVSMVNSVCRNLRHRRVPQAGTYKSAL